jgi:hypothetical protein
MFLLVVDDLGIGEGPINPDIGSKHCKNFQNKCTGIYNQSTKAHVPGWK